MQGRKVGPAKKEGHAQYEAALQILHILANQQGEAEATLKTATSLSKLKQTDFSSAPNHAAMKPIANWSLTGCRLQPIENVGKQL